MRVRAVEDGVEDVGDESDFFEFFGFAFSLAADVAAVDFFLEILFVVEVPNARFPAGAKIRDDAERGGRHDEDDVLLNLGYGHVDSR